MKLPKSADQCEMIHIVSSLLFHLCLVLGVDLRVPENLLIVSFRSKLEISLFSGTFATYFTLYIAQVPCEILIEYLLGQCFDGNISYCSHERDF